MARLSKLEREVLEMDLRGDEPALATLRRQLDAATVAGRRLTGTGFVTTLNVPSGIARAPVTRARFSDVQATIRGLRYGAGFLVYVDDGLLSGLEGYSYEEAWPESVEPFELRYRDDSRPSLIRSLFGRLDKQS